MRITNASRMDATAGCQRASQALIGKNPAAEEIERGNASNPQNHAKRRRKEARDFKNFTHYIPPDYMLPKSICLLFPR